MRHYLTVTLDAFERNPQIQKDKRVNTCVAGMFFKFIIILFGKTDVIEAISPKISKFNEIVFLPWWSHLIMVHSCVFNMYFMCSLYAFMISSSVICSSLCTALCKPGFKMCYMNKMSYYTVIITILEKLAQMYLRGCSSTKNMLNYSK